MEQQSAPGEAVNESEIKGLVKSLKNKYHFDEITNTLEKNLSWVMGEMRSFEVTTDRLVCRLGKLIDFMYHRVHDKVPNKVLVRNLAQHCDEKTIKTLFEVCGEIEAIEMVLDKRGTFSGTAYVTFESVESAKVALLLQSVPLKNNALSVTMCSDVKYLPQARAFKSFAQRKYSDED